MTLHTLFKAAVLIGVLVLHTVAWAQTNGGIDSDGDGAIDGVDNCTLVANPAQTDSDVDGIGNACDADIAVPNDCIINFLDLNVLKASFFATPASPTWNPDADFDSDSTINFNDLQIIKSRFFGTPGPSAVDELCTPGVFVTSTLHDGNLGGVTGGDAICQARAEAAGLAGAWLAWLGDGALTPESGFARLTTPYRRVDGVTVANDYDDLVDASIAAPIEVTEVNTIIDDTILGEGNVWTGLAANGSDVLTNCSDWTCDTSNCVGETGSTNSINDDWSSGTGRDCSVPRRLYCFRQSGLSLAGDWLLDGEGALGVGPAAGDVSWWSIPEVAIAVRDCLFDDVFRFRADSTFQNIQDGETWLEPWQGADPEACGVPVAPHDGSSPGTWSYDAAAGTLTINGTGSHLGLPKAVNGEELVSSGDAPASITYQVLTLDAETLTVTIDVGFGIWWTFRFAR